MSLDPLDLMLDKGRMTDHSDAVTKLARDLVRIDSRSFVSNHAISDRIEAALPDFELERLDYRDLNGVAKRALVAHRRPEGYARDGAGGLCVLRAHGHRAGYRLAQRSLERTDS